MYKELFEGRFTKTLEWNNLSWLGKIYYILSPSTYTERKIVHLLRNSVGSKKDLKVIDIGCGGGNQNLLSYGHVTGIDVSEESIKNANRIYDNAFVADATKSLDLNCRYDVVYSSEVLGHIHLNDKDHFLAEIQKLASDSTVIVMSVETFGDNWLTKYLRNRNLYTKLWVDTWGHIGLENLQDTANRIKKYFVVERMIVSSTYVFSADVLGILSDDLVLFKAFRNKWIVRAFNILITVPFYISLRFYSDRQVNNVVFLLKRK